MLVLTLFEGVDALHGLLVRGVATDAPHRVGGIENQTALLEDAGSLIDRRRKGCIGFRRSRVSIIILLSHTILFL